MVEGRKLTEIINSTHENVKSAPAASSRGMPHVICHVTLNRYLPGRLLPENVVAIPDICDAARGPLPCILHAASPASSMLCISASKWFAGATILVVVTPHQFIGKQLPLLKSVIAPTCHAISLIKVFAILSSDVRGALLHVSALPPLMHVRASSSRATTSASYHQSLGAAPSCDV